MGLLTKAYFIALVPLVLAAYIFRRRWRDSAPGLVIILTLAGPWYVRNIR